jgi:hypothetical protein
MASPPLPCLAMGGTSMSPVQYQVWKDRDHIMGGFGNTRDEVFIDLGEVKTRHWLEVRVYEMNVMITVQHSLDGEHWFNLREYEISGVPSAPGYHAERGFIPVGQSEELPARYLNFKLAGVASVADHPRLTVHGVSY